MTEANEDFFQPRPKTSRAVKVIRFSAFLAALFSQLVLNLAIFIVATPHPEPLISFMEEPQIVDYPLSMKITYVSVLLSMNLIHSFICWRCYLLKKWACVPLGMEAVLATMVTQGFFFIVAWPFYWACKTEWKNLKRGI